MHPHQTVDKCINYPYITVVLLLYLPYTHSAQVCTHTDNIGFHKTKCKPLLKNSISSWNLSKIKKKHNKYTQTHTYTVTYTNIMKLLK